MLSFGLLQIHIASYDFILRPVGHIIKLLKRQPHKMVKHTQTIPWNCLSVFNHFVRLTLKGLNH